ncbi:MAG: hypothetical protein CL844_06530 [Crocinitomicaceae bacterium]|nr:hypothetical protein [Crocinitomicaceae bacterium]
MPTRRTLGTDPCVRIGVQVGVVAAGTQRDSRPCGAVAGARQTGGDGAVAAAVAAVAAADNSYHTHGAHGQDSVRSSVKGAARRPSLGRFGDGGGVRRVLSRNGDRGPAARCPRGPHLGPCSCAALRLSRRPVCGGVDVERGGEEGGGWSLACAKCVWYHFLKKPL